MQFNPEDQ